MSGLTSPSQIAILLVVLLLVFGVKRLPELGRSLGHGLREFKDSVGGESLAELSEPAAVPSLGAAPSLTEDPVLAAEPAPVASAVATSGPPRPSNGRR